MDSVQYAVNDFFNLPFVKPQGTNHPLDFLHKSLLIKINNQFITTLQFIIRIMLIRGDSRKSQQGKRGEAMAQEERILYTGQ